MLKNYKLIFSGLMSLALSTSVLADEVKCPSVASLKQGMFTKIESFDGLHYYVYQSVSNYDTQKKWRFAFYSIEATSTSDAFEKAKKSLPTLVFKEGPIQDPSGTWQCIYDSATGYRGVAKTV